MKKQKAKKTSDKKNGEASSGKTLDAIALLKADHRQVKSLFQKFESSSSDEQKKNIADQICKELIVHAKIEEELFYPTCRQNGVEMEGLNEAQIEHDTAKILIQNLMDGEPGDPYFDATVKVLSEYIQHHVDEEEMPNSGIFAQAKKHGIDLEELGKKLKESKEQLQEQDVFISPPLKTVAIKQHGKESDAMARRYNQDYEDDNNQSRYSQRSQSQRENRDQYGRFMSDDNNRGRSGRGSYEQDDGSQRYSYQGSSSGNRYQDDDENWGGSQGRSQSRGSQNYGGSSGRGQESQSRYSNRYEDDDDRRYGSSSSSSRGGRGSQGQRGWFGDSEGHSEAAEKSWENRGRYGQSSYEDDDEDDNRRYSSRSSYERSSQGRDEGRSSSGGSRGGSSGSSSRGGSEGQGGWFGDSEGHSEAARRGWRNR